MGRAAYATAVSDSGNLLDAVERDFVSHFVPGGRVIHRGDGRQPHGVGAGRERKNACLSVVDAARLPDMVVHDPSRNWLFLVEAVTGHGPVDEKRRVELAHLFSTSRAGLIFVTACPTRVLAGRHMGEIAWETEVWVAEAPTHLIHFNGSRFLGPYTKR